MNGAQFSLIEPYFKDLGFCLIKKHRHKNSPGVDVWAETNLGVYSVEVKTARLLKNGTIQVPPVEPRRRSDDLIAIIIGKYVFIEAMKDHLQCCGRGGTRQMTLLKSALMPKSRAMRSA